MIQTPKGRVVIYSQLPDGHIIAAFGSISLADFAFVRELSEDAYARTRAEEANSDEVDLYSWIFKTTKPVLDEMFGDEPGRTLDVIVLSNSPDEIQSQNMIQREMAKYQKMIEDELKKAPISIEHSTELEKLSALTGIKLEPISK